MSALYGYESSWTEESQPHWHEPSEMATLGCCLLQPDWIPWISTRLKPGHFYKPAHKMLYATMMELVRSGKEVNTITLEDALNSVNRQADCGGPMYPLELANFTNNLIGTGSLNSSIDKVLEYWARREIDAIGKSAWEEPVDLLKERFEAVKAEASGPIEARSGHISKFASTRRRKSGCPSGIPIVDTSTVTQGWPDGQMSVISAYTGTGKSAMMLQSAIHVAKNGGRVVYGTWADLSGADIHERLVKAICGWSYRPDYDHEAKAYDEACDLVNSLPIDIYDTASLRGPGKTLEVFGVWLKRQHDAKPVACCFMDYAQKLKIQVAKGMSEVARADATSDTLQWLAADTRIPVVVGSQITPGNEREGRMSMTKGSRAWEEDCAILLRVKLFTDDERAKHPENEYRGIQGLTAVELTKNRFGESRLIDYAKWDKRTVSFQPL